MEDQEIKHFMRCRLVRRIASLITSVLLATACSATRATPSQAVPTCDELDRRVKEVVAELATLRREKAAQHDLSRRQEQLFIGLQRLGIRAVPALVRHMDSRALLPSRNISLERRASSERTGMREGLVHYDVEKVVDGIAYVLSALLSGWRYHETTATDESRDETVARWREFVASEFHREFARTHPDLCPP